MNRARILLPILAIPFWFPPGVPATEQRVTAVDCRSDLPPKPSARIEGS